MTLPSHWQINAFCIYTVGFEPQTETETESLHDREPESHSVMVPTTRTRSQTTSSKSTWELTQACKCPGLRLESKTESESLQASLLCHGCAVVAGADSADTQADDHYGHQNDSGAASGLLKSSSIEAVATAGGLAEQVSEQPEH